ncbi:hypothetical protein CERZMDRAFT_101042 [Cercospora zeae-maydis SCOH1-5]|uniref:Uncharacterized protein n=1 Tax=Cercospora zeae-maydis SCOH1-5 TaxID=717836 RepID=A0A6A6F4V4_9PEZI|nr:hypothetical protein CERZMDRAFT_101042 [Cercospora zeae-maydis SCOH1-5]
MWEAGICTSRFVRLDAHDDETPTSSLGNDANATYTGLSDASISDVASPSRVLLALRNIWRSKPLKFAIWFEPSGSSQSLKAGAEVTIVQALCSKNPCAGAVAVGSGLVGSSDVKLQHGRSKHSDELAQSSRWPCGQNSCVLLVLTSTPENPHYPDPEQDD